MAADSTVSLVEADVLARGAIGRDHRTGRPVRRRHRRASSARFRRAIERVDTLPPGATAVNERHRTSASSARAARQLLDVRPDAGEQDLRRAFRRAARVAHPDGGGTSGDLAALRAARDLLLDGSTAMTTPRWTGAGLRPSPTPARQSSRPAVAASPSRRSWRQSKGSLNTMRTPHVGLFLGAILGFALIVEGFGEMLIVALFAGLGWLVASVLSGTIDVGEVLSSQRDRSAGRR